MAITKPLTTETIALTEKKMDMTLDAIIQMGKGSGNKAKKQRRPANKSQSFSKTTAQDKSTKARRYIDSRSSVRQGFLAQRRSNFQGNQFPVTNVVARKAATSAPFSNKAFANNQGVAHWKSRVPEKKPGNGRFAAKKKQQDQASGTFASNIEVPKQQLRKRPQTLDSLFASMKEERMRTLSTQNNNTIGRFQSQRRGRGGFRN